MIRVLDSADSTLVEWGRQQQQQQQRTHEFEDKTMLKNKQIKFSQQSNNEIKQFIKINLNYCLNNAAAERKITEIS